MDDVEDGLTSGDFNLGDNLMEGDARSGLDDVGRREVKKIMKKQKIDFDGARKIYVEGRFAKNNIGPEVGIPLLLRWLALNNHALGLTKGPQICVVFLI